MAGEGGDRASIGNFPAWREIGWWIDPAANTRSRTWIVRSKVGLGLFKIVGVIMEFEFVSGIFETKMGVCYFPLS